MKLPSLNTQIFAGVVLGIAIGAGFAALGKTSPLTQNGLYAAGLVGTLFVGIAEETLTRGLLLTAFRGGMGEVGVWFWTSLLFGLLHSLNILFGQSVGATILQIAFAFVLGSVLYACRRATGLLAIPIVLHGLWDFTTFLSTGEGATVSSGAQGIIVYGAVIVCIVALFKRSLFRAAPTESVTAQTATV